ncbi:hypothetical protein K0I73_15970 [Shewanella mesophila]|uniref:hypothetical protein n=1 Tax=Shewanella mesophila TaxID=2864208 RepID=UPI001C655CDB|nr:hypothetical protein [Shewanella mesophila]QYJ85662.1 hypothetical protein K0I73_15970 [Shewanella mesophila]
MSLTGSVLFQLGEGLGIACHISQCNASIVSGLPSGYQILIGYLVVQSHVEQYWILDEID